MDSQAKSAVEGLLVFALLVMVLFISFVLAAHVVTLTTGGATEELVEDISKIINITVNNSDANQIANITQVNITVPSGFTIGADNNTDAVNYTFVESATVLSWENFTVFLMNGTSGGGTIFNFWLNVSVATPGSYNITVMTLNGTGENYANISVNVNDTTVPEIYAANISSPSSGVNRSGTNLLMNVSVADNGAIQGVIFNITNITGVQNATYAATQEGSTDAYSTYLNTSDFPDGAYNISARVNDTANNLNSTAFVSFIYFDNTVPKISAGNISSPVAAGNYSGTLVLNVSAVDLTSNMGTVFFNITNLTGTQNATYTATREGTTNEFSTSLETTDFPDGIYNVTVFANDTGGNLNSTAFVSLMRFDNTNPDVAHACTPTIVSNVGDTVTCTCSATDATSGVEVAAAHTANPDTSNTGAYTTACTATDYAGNLGTSNVEYTVEQGGGVGAGGGGGGSSESWVTYSVVKEFSEKRSVSRDLKKNQRIRLEVSGSGGLNERHTVGVKSVISGRVKIEVASEIQTFDLGIGESVNAEITGDNYYDISIEVTKIVGSLAGLKIVPVNILVPSLAPEVEVVGEPEPEEEVAPPVEQPEIEEPSGGSGFFIVIILIIVAVFVVFFLMGPKKKRKKSH